MNAISIQPLTKNKEFLIFIIVSMALTFYLFYLDEGYFDLRWMKNPGNWFWYFIYTSGFVSGLQTISSILKKYKGLLRNLTVYIIGLPLGYVFTFLFILLLGFIVNGSWE